MSLAYVTEFGFIKCFCENVETATRLHSSVNPTLNFMKPDLKHLLNIMNSSHLNKLLDKAVFRFLPLL